jgi:hypothetical protein
MNLRPFKLFYSVKILKKGYYKLGRNDIKRISSKIWMFDGIYKEKRIGGLLASISLFIGRLLSIEVYTQVKN